MRDDVAAKLIALNREFYQTFAGDFAETRRRSQPGVVRSLGSIPPEASVLDLGCGAGTAAQVLRLRGHRGPYLGLDENEGLLAEARRRVPERRFEFGLADLTQADWPPQVSRPFDRALLFAVLHHLPGKVRRITLLRQIAGVLAPEGRLHLSMWDVRRNRRLMGRWVDWEEVGLSTPDVEPGDFLIDWRRGGRGLRYVHVFEAEELRRLAGDSGFSPEGEFESDGAGGRQSLYQTWRRASPSGAA